ncbi:MAG: methyltransferase [Phycisphaerales bacterium]|nr:methyltransferase [Phycisphaerales bacterium]
MTPRERVLAAVEHREPDYTPMDLGGTPVTGIHCSIVEALRKHYGLPQRLVKVHEPYQMLGMVEDDLKEAMGVDTVGVPAPNTIFGFPPENYKPWTAPWGQDLLVPADFHTTSNAEGDQFIYPKGDMSVGPSGHMPASSFFFDTIIRQPEIDEDKLDVEENMEEFELISDSDLKRFASMASAARKTGRCVVANLPGAALGDIALVPAPFLVNPKGIRDITEWYMSLAVRQDYVKELFARQTAIALQNFKTINDACGDDLDVVMLCGTDFGTQNSTFCSNDTFRDIWLPYYRQMNDWIHANTKWKTFKHSCGAVIPLINSFIDAGFDILNPVQCSAGGMDPQVLKEQFGDRITFWGGGVDTQRVLPFGTPEEVRQQVSERLRIFSKNGGFVFNTIHNIQAKTPIENLVAMLETRRQFNGQ